MKRFLSIMLCVMMLVSVFSIGASAMVPTSYEVVTSPAVPEIPYVNQDFSDAEDTEFTEVHEAGFGTPAVIEEPGNTTNKVMQLTTDTRAKLDAATLNTVLTDNDKKLNIEFRVYPVGQAETISVGVCMPALLEATDDKDTYARENYYVINSLNFNANAWNTVKVEMHISDSYSVSNTSYPESANATASATVTVNNAELTCVPGSAGNTAAAGKYTVKGNYTGTGPTGLDKDREVELAYIAVSGVVAGLDTTAPADGRKVYLDDIKIYKPAVAETVETYDYPVNDGKVVYENDPVTVSAASLGFDGVKTTGSKRTVSSSHTADLGAYVIVTFDARNTAGDYPLGVQVCDGKSNGTDSMARANVFASSAIGSDWYTYKLVSGVTDERISSLALYRKPAGSDVAYTKLTYSTDYETWTSGSGAGSKHVQIGLFYNDKAVSAKPAETVWEVRNFQVIDASNGGAVTGKATAKADGTADVKLFYTAKPGATTPIVAVYDGTKLVDIAYAATPAQGEGVIEANVDYATGNTVKLYVWDGIATGVPVLSNPIPITVQ